MKTGPKSWKFVSFWVEKDELCELLSRFFSSGATRVSGVVFHIFYSTKS